MSDVAIKKKAKNR